MGNKLSLRIKDNKTEYALINPKHHTYLVPVFAQYIAKKLELHAIEQHPAVLQVNEKHKGIF